jgi:hypothetical protein
VKQNQEWGYTKMIARVVLVVVLVVVVVVEVVGM